MGDKTTKSEVPDETRRARRYQEELQRIELQCAQLPTEEALKLRFHHAMDRSHAAFDRLQQAIAEALFHEEESETARANFCVATGVPQKTIERIRLRASRLAQRRQMSVEQIARRILRIDWRFGFFGPDGV